MIDHVSIMIVQFSNNHELFVHPEFNWEIGNILLASLNLSNLFTLNKRKCFSNYRAVVRPRSNNCGLNVNNANTRHLCCGPHGTKVRIDVN